MNTSRDRGAEDDGPAWLLAAVFGRLGHVWGTPTHTAARPRHHRKSGVPDDPWFKKSGCPNASEIPSAAAGRCGGGPSSSPTLGSSTRVALRGCRAPKQLGDPGSRADDECEAERNQGWSGRKFDRRCSRQPPSVLGRRASKRPDSCAPEAKVFMASIVVGVPVRSRSLGLYCPLPPSAYPTPDRPGATSSAGACGTARARTT